jgi:tRNA threonylcarbamoyladenosine biosynthesis protein TsaE
MITKEINSNSIEDTLHLAKAIGTKLRGGEIIELIGDLGSGKTTFVSGLVDGTGSEDIVSSPTFMIKKEYATQDLIIHHFDFYRLDKSDLIIHELEDAIAQPKSVVVIEWPKVIKLPNMGSRISFEFFYEKEIYKRIIKIESDDKLGYLIN